MPVHHLSPARFVASLWLAFASSMLAAGCSSSSGGACAAEGTVTVTVTDEDVDSDSNFLCHAKVTITSASGGSARTLTGQGFDGSNVSCIYVVNVAPGKYVLHATSDGYTSLTQDITVQSVGCLTSSPSFRMALMETNVASADAGSDVSIFRSDAAVDGGETFAEGGAVDTGADAKAPKDAAKAD